MGTPLSRISITGAPERTVTLYGISTALPAASTARKVNALTPSANGTPAMAKFFDASVTADSAVVMIDIVAASLAVPVIAVGTLPTVVPGTGERLVSDGGVRSIVNCSVFCAVSPAQSAAFTASACVPSALMVEPETYAAASSA